MGGEKGFGKGQLDSNWTNKKVSKHLQAEEIASTNVLKQKAYSRKSSRPT